MQASEATRLREIESENAKPWATAADHQARERREGLQPRQCSGWTGREAATAQDGGAGRGNQAGWACGRWGISCPMSGDFPADGRQNADTTP